MARKPKGSIIQPLPSWNIRNMASGGIQVIPITFGDSHGFGVYNNATDGSWLVLFDFRLHYYPDDSNSGINLVDIGHLHGNDGNSLTKGSSLVATNPAIPGAIWDEANFQDHTDDYLYLIGEQGSFTWSHDWPLGAVPPGWSLVAITDGNAATVVGVNFIWEIVAQI